MLFAPQKYFSLLSCLFLAACSALPMSGPDYRDISGNAVTTLEAANLPAFNYALVDLNQAVVSNAVDIGPGSFFKSFKTGKGPAPEILVGVGDVVQISIFESKSGGLFIPADSGTRPGNFVTLPTQTVDRKGTLSVPYAGEINAVGRSLPEIEREIESKLARRAIEPQAVVALTEQNSTMVSVVGEVNTAAKLKIRRSGERVLDMISQAGGIKYPGYETYVTLQRGKRKATVYFNSLVAHPDENVFVSPGDTIYVYREPRRFLAFGANGMSSASAAAGLSNQFNFDQERVSLAEGVAKSGGLMDDRANPGQIFLYRLEAREVLGTMGVDLTKFPPNQEAIPTVYRANFRDPASYFYAQQFPMRMRDVLYVSNADSVEVMKFLNFARGITSTVAGVTQDAAATSHGARYLATGHAPGL
jgi:polysaccharide biosynthesis/export protein